jgi:glutathione S-transferase
MAKNSYVTGSTYNLADINLGSVLNILHALEIDLKPYPNSLKWLGKIMERPSFKKVASLPR